MYATFQLYGNVECNYSIKSLCKYIQNFSAVKCTKNPNEMTLFTERDTRISVKRAEMVTEMAFY